MVRPLLPPGPLLVLILAAAAPATAATRPAREGPVSLHLSTTTPWERQAVTVELRHRGDDPWARLEIPPLDWSGGESRPLPLRRERLGDGTTLLVGGWQIWPLAPGIARIQPPAVTWRSRGRMQQRIPLGEIRLRVRPLPSWLPPDLPVGPVRLRSRLEPERQWLATGRLAVWEVEIRGPGVLPGSLPELEGHIRSTRGLEVLEPVRSTRVVEGPDGAEAVRLYRFPLRGTRSGRLPLPALRVAWFDPVRGRLEHASGPAPRVWVVGPIPLVLAGALTLAAAWRPGRRAWGRLGLALQRRRLRRRAIAAIRCARDCAALRAAVQRLAEARGLGPHLPLRRLARQWPSPDEELRRCLERLDRACHGPDGEAAEILRAALLDRLAARRLPWRSRRPGPPG